MASGNYVRNTELSAMLKAAESAQSSRLRRGVQNFQNGENLPPRLNTTGPEKANVPEKEVKTVVAATPASDPLKLSSESISLTLDEIEWLDEVWEKNGHSDFSGVFSRLVDWANQEPPEIKKKLFLAIRCRRCSAGAKGGVKRDRDIELTSQQWQWLEGVKGRCKHVSVGKTLRILIDFYMPLCKDDADFEKKVLRAGSNIQSRRHEDAVKSVDPARALAIKGGERPH